MYGERPTRRAAGGLRLFGTMLLLTAWPAQAHAHTRLLRSAPSAGVVLDVAPREIRLTFNEAPELGFTSVILRAADGRSVTLTSPMFVPDAPTTLVCVIRGTITAGRYVVEWKAGGSDGHPVKGTIAFTVGAAAARPVTPSVATLPTSAGNSSQRIDTVGAHHDPALMPESADDGAFGSESPLYAAVRWLQYVGLLLVIGCAAFGTLVVGSVLRFHPADSALARGARSRAARLGRAGIVVVAISAVMRLFAQFYAMNGMGAPLSRTDIWSMMRETSWGTGWLVQIIAVIVTGVGFLIATRQSFPIPSNSDATVRPPALSWGWTIAALGAVALAFTPGLASHAASAPRLSALAMVADGLHVLGAGGWLGSLSVVVLAGIPAAWALPEDARGPAVADLINAFSPTALVFAGIVATTGVFAAWLHVGSVSALWMTTYGRVLLVKLAVLSLVAGTGAYNWLRVKPGLGSVQAAQRVRRLASTEVLIGVIVVIITAVLVATPAGADMQM